MSTKNVKSKSKAVSKNSRKVKAPKEPLFDKTNANPKEFFHESDIPNDIIDIYAKPDVKITKIKSDNPNEFIAEIYGNSVDFSISNAIRRTIDMSIPIYGFHRSNIHTEVEKSNHMYNNDFIYNQLEPLPIYDIPNTFDLENPDLYLTSDVMKSIFGSFVPERYDTVSEEEKEIVDTNKKLQKIELYLSLKNNTGGYKFVSTHDVVLKVNDKISNSYKNRPPICLLVLKPDEEISLSAKANLGIGLIYASYEATTNPIHIELSPSKYRLIYETREQLDKDVIFSKACIILSKKLQNLIKYINKKFPEEMPQDEVVSLELYGEDHTLGVLLSTALQKCEFVEKAGYKLPHLFERQVTISYKLESESKHGPIKVLIDTIQYLVNLFETLIKLSSK